MLAMQFMCSSCRVVLCTNTSKRHSPLYGLALLHLLTTSEEKVDSVGITELLINLFVVEELCGETWLHVLKLPAAAATAHTNSHTP